MGYQPQEVMHIDLCVVKVSKELDRGKQHPQEGRNLQSPADGCLLLGVHDRRVVEHKHSNASVPGKV